MTLTLTADQKAALDANPSSMHLLDDRTNVEYALLRIDPLQAATLKSLEAVWADPAMDEYDNYDENLKRVRGTNP